MRMQKQREKCYIIAHHFINTEGSTIRETAKYFGMNKSTVFRYLKEILPKYDKSKAAKVEEILQYNKSVRHIRGGESTKRLYSKIKSGELFLNVDDEHKGPDDDSDHDDEETVEIEQTNLELEHLRNKMLTLAIARLEIFKSKVQQNRKEGISNDTANMFVYLVNDDLYDSRIDGTTLAKLKTNVQAIIDDVRMTSKSRKKKDVLKNISKIDALQSQIKDLSTEYIK